MNPAIEEANRLWREGLEQRMRERRRRAWREAHARRRKRARMRRAYAEGAYQAAVNYWSRLVYHGRSVVVGW